MTTVQVALSATTLVGSVTVAAWCLRHRVQTPIRHTSQHEIVQETNYVNKCALKVLTAFVVHCSKLFSAWCSFMPLGCQP